MTHGTPLSGGLWTPTRRAVVRGIAWATPTLTVAAAAPALPASPPSGEPTLEGVEPPFAALRCASVTAYGVGTITPQPGAIIQLTRTPSSNASTPAITTSGLHYWQNATTGDSVSATLMSGTAGAVQLSTWSTRENQFTHGGGLVMPHGTIGTWQDNHGLKKPASAPQGVQPLIVTQTASYALTAGGVLSSEGSAFSTSPGGSGWTERESGVSSFSAWGVYQTAGGGTHYTGGAYVSVDGAVVAFGAISNASRAWTTTEKTFPADVSTSKVFGSDGMYLSLATNGDVYAWAGNVFAGDMTPQMKNPGQPASDLEVWGYHRTGAGEFYGGGYIISSPGACA